MRAFLWISLAVATAARAESWYVEPGAPGGDGSQGAPFHRIADATAVARPGDQIYLAAGVYTETQTVLVYGEPWEALLDLPDSVEVIGAGRDQTFLRGLGGAGVGIGIRGTAVSRATLVRSLAIDGEIVQGVQLVGGSPTLLELTVRNMVQSGSTLAFDGRDGSFPEVRDCLFDGGHSAVFIEFGSGGIFRNCVLASRPNETLAITGSNPELIDCEIREGGRDTIVLNAGSQPVLSRCEIGRGTRWTVRVFGYPLESNVNLGGNSWFSSDTQEIQASILDARDDPALGARVRVSPLWNPVAVEVISMGSLRAIFGPE